MTARAWRDDDFIGHPSHKIIIGQRDENDRLRIALSAAERDRDEARAVVGPLINAARVLVSVHMEKGTLTPSVLIGAKPEFYNANGYVDSWMVLFNALRDLDGKTDRPLSSLIPPNLED